ncbi:hypothetical protein GALL_481610 [mine drainage metagenome]|uniref:Uncharacterized protein n=1 Tax=mine drainage metagenome TaxID=410659 RepID=A0A1J5PRM0_9ZZZZ
MQEDGDFLVAIADFLHELAQDGQRGLRLADEFFIVDGKYESRGTTLLLRERCEVAVTGDAQNFESFFLDGFGEHSNAEAGSVLGAEVFVDDDDWEAEFHGKSLKAESPGNSGNI